MQDNHRNETMQFLRTIKNALIAEGFNVFSVHMGRGTASNWIEAVIETKQKYDLQPGTPEHEAYWNDQHKAYAIVKHAAGRDDRHDDIQTDYFCENILVEQDTLEEWTRHHQPKPKKPESEKRVIDYTSCTPIINGRGEKIEGYVSEPGKQVEGYGLPDMIVHGPRADFYLHRNKKDPLMLWVSCSSENIKRRGACSKIRGATWLKETPQGLMLYC